MQWSENLPCSRIGGPLIRSNIKIHEYIKSIGIALRKSVHPVNTRMMRYIVEPENR